MLTGKATVTNTILRNEKNGIVELSVEVYNQNSELVIKNVTEAETLLKWYEDRLG